MRVIITYTFLILIISTSLSLAQEHDGIRLYNRYCASCHHEKRYGRSAPPLIPDTLRRYSNTDIEGIIRDGLPSTNMPPFKTILDNKGIKSIVAYIKSPLVRPEWNRADILNTRRLINIPVERPLHGYNLSNIFMIVEGGKGSVAIMDGDSFRILDRVRVGAIHGGPKYDYSFHYAYMVSRDGWVVKYDLYQLKEIGRIRVAINTRNIAVSDDNRFVAVADYLPDNIVILDTDRMEPIRIIDTGTRVGAVYNIRGKGVFVALLKGKAELWLLHYQNGFSIDKLSLPYAFDDIFLEPEGRFIIGTSRKEKGLFAFDLVRKEIVGDIPIDGMPHLASAALWRNKDGLFAAIPHIRTPNITILKLYDWSIVKTIPTKGSGFFARTHRDSDYIWVDTNTDTIEIIDKKSLEIVQELVPEAGKKAMHIEFTKDGRYALVSIWEKDGAVVIYDSLNFRILKRIPFVKPVGKYNATNKTRVY